MKRIIRLSAMIILAAGVGPVASLGADAPALANEPALSMLVGDYGRESALVIHGNKTFTKEQILAGLKFQLDFHLASHPAAPLAEFTALLERQVTRGYLRAGFPSVLVKAAAAHDLRQIVVQVQEGPRYRCGEILLSGVPSMTDDLVRRRIEQVMAEFEDESAWRSNAVRGNLRGYAQAVAWQSGETAPFDGVFSELVTNRVREAMTALGYLHPKFTAHIVPDSVRKLADLKIEFADEGMKGTIAEIEVTGLHTNTRSQLLEYLKLQPGMELNATLVTATSNQLWRSARFFRQDVSVVPLPASDRFKLTMDLDEVPEVPPVGQEFSAKEKALLKFRDWLAGWETSANDFVISANVSNSLERGTMDLVLSPSGTALAIREAVSNRPPRLQYALVASKELVGLYSVWRQCKFIMPQTNAPGHVLLKLRPPSPKSYGAGNISFGINMGFTNWQPFSLELELQPAVFVSMAHWMDSSLKEGVLTLSQPSDEGRQEILIDVATGRLIQASGWSSESGADMAEIRPGIGAFARLQQEITAATAEHANCYVSNRGFSSWASFVVTDLLKSPRFERMFGWSGAEISSRQSKAVLALAREVLDERNLDTVFEPLNRLFRSKPDSSGNEYFVVPVETQRGSLATSPRAMLCIQMLNSSEDLMSANSGLGILIRESILTVAGQNPYSQTELDKLLKSEDIGPLGCLAASYLAGWISPKQARKFAERGLERLNLNESRKDYRLLLRTNFIVSDLVGKVLGVLKGVDVAKLTPMLAELRPDEAAFMQQLFRLLAEAEGKGQSPTDAAWLAIDQHWEKIPRRYLEAALNQFLPQAKFLTNSQALFDRGRSLIAPDLSLIDPEEAIQCFRKAAELGHAQAQVSLGHFYEAGQGVPKDYTEALQWYRKAAEQKGKHALCSIGVLYQFGKGVPQDLDEAATWYHRELNTSDGCICAQMNLGQILETKSAPEEALKWYRLAAAGGMPPAQARLGDMLSDGLSTKPDYVEACQWLSLAAAAGDKVSAIRLRRVKTKLTSEQWNAVDQRVTTISRQLKEKEKADAKAANP